VPKRLIVLNIISISLPTPVMFSYQFFWIYNHFNFGWFAISNVIGVIQSIESNAAIALVSTFVVI